MLKNYSKREEARRSREACIDLPKRNFVTESPYLFRRGALVRISKGRNNQAVEAIANQRPHFSLLSSHKISRLSPHYL